jgi:predicted O-methyltransferase YrrM
MKVKRRLNKYLTKSLRKMRYRKGFGVHSPFAYSLITQVINENTPFYDYESILQLVRRYSSLPGKTPNFVYRHLPSTRLLFLLYRLINRFGATRLLEVGNKGGLVSYVMCLPNTRAELISVSDDPAQTARAEALFADEMPRKHTFIAGRSIPNLLTELPADYRADFIYVHAEAALFPDLLFNELRQLLADDGTVYIERIQTNRDARRLWTLFRHDPRVRLSFDLYEVGICIARERFFKQHYIVSF